MVSLYNMQSSPVNPKSVEKTLNASVTRWSRYCLLVTRHAKLSEPLLCPHYLSPYCTMADVVTTVSANPATDPVIDDGEEDESKVCFGCIASLISYTDCTRAGTYGVFRRFSS